jgi:3-hydroxyisobutyrate dehydrogenase
MVETTQPVGFIGLGSMGGPMALNLAKAGTRLLVWNRSLGKAAAAAGVGAHIATDVAEVFTRTMIVILMLTDEAAIDAVLQRDEDGFESRVRAHTVVNMSTTSPVYSRALEAAIRAVGGRYVEAPVSGSRKPAEAGQLVGMLAGEAEAIEQVRPLLAPMCRETIVCGAVPEALVMKLAVNIFLLSTVTGLAESVHFAERYGLDLSQLAVVLNGGQMASAISRVKVPKLIDRDFLFTPQSQTF